MEQQFKMSNSVETKYPSHNLVEDTVAILLSAIFISLGVFFFKQVALLSGGVTGLALLISQITEIHFGHLFILLNAPFFILAYFNVSKTVAIKSLFCAILVSLVTDNLDSVIQINLIEPYYAAITGGFLFGMGLLALIRHESSLGGFTILALLLQEKYNVSAGKTKLLIDFAVLSTSLIYASIEIFLLSLLGVTTLNVVIALFHKKGRYQGVG